MERVPHQAPARSPLKEAFRSYWRTILHQTALVAGLAVGFYTTFVYAATWLAQVAQVPARTALSINTLAMALSLGASLAAGALSDRIGRRPVLLAWAGTQAVLAYPLMALMGRGELGGMVAGHVTLALLVAAGSGALPATMAELAPWRVRCTVVAVAHNLAMALLGGTTPLVGAWLVARTGHGLAPAVYLAAAGAVSFVAAYLLPKTAPHRLTKEFEAARYR
jgi:MHS family proline/betaine transporter-like MFS transporter